MASERSNPSVPDAAVPRSRHAPSRAVVARQDPLVRIARATILLDGAPAALRFE
jgi:hypothetical protein